MTAVTHALLGLAVLLLAVAPALAAPAAPGFKVKQLDGARTFDLRDMVGKKVVVLRFQASYCKPCVRESAALSRLTARYAERGVEVWALHVQDTPSDVRRFMRAQKPGYAIAVDPKLVVGNRYGVKGTPYTIVIDKKGEIILRHSGVGAIGRLPKVLDDALAPPR
ncbi:MAG: TlpA family protein disulfide reductase [Candidatus Rokubacteria bacterium]|nr:TlpA family protein disulfide reductase [Candidatus Rokubacteria bacterium]